MADLDRMSPTKENGSPTRLPRNLELVAPPSLKLVTGALSPSKRASRSRGASPLPRAKGRSPLSPANGMSPRGSPIRRSSPLLLRMSPSKRSSPGPTTASPSSHGKTLSTLARDSGFFSDSEEDDEKENSANNNDNGSDTLEHEPNDVGLPEVTATDLSFSTPESLAKSEREELDDEGEHLDDSAESDDNEELDDDDDTEFHSLDGKSNRPKKVCLVLPSPTSDDGKDEDLPFSSITASTPMSLILQESLSEHSCLYSDARMEEEEPELQTPREEEGTVASTVYEGSVASFFTAVEASGCFDRESIASLKKLQKSDYFDFIVQKDKLMAELKDSFGSSVTEEEEEEDEEEDTSESTDEGTDGKIKHISTTETEYAEEITEDTYSVTLSVTTDCSEEEGPRRPSETTAQRIESPTTLVVYGPTDVFHKNSVHTPANYQPAIVLPQEIHTPRFFSPQAAQSPSTPAITTDFLLEQIRSPSPQKAESPISSSATTLSNLHYSTPLLQQAIQCVCDILQETSRKRAEEYPLLTYEPVQTSPSNDSGTLVIYKAKRKQAFDFRPVRKLLWDPNVKYGLALFQLLVLKQGALESEQKNDLNQQKVYLDQMVKTLEFCLTLKDERNAYPIQMEIAQTLDILGCLHRDGLQDYPQSFLYYTQALETKSHIYGENAKNLDLAGSMEILGVLMRDRLGCVTDSIRCFVQALQMKQHVFEKHPTYLPFNNRPSNVAKQYSELAQTYHSLGLAYDMTADYEKAYTYYEKALTLRKKQQELYSRKHGQNVHQQRRKQLAIIKTAKQLIATLYNIGCVCEKLKKLEEGRDYFEDALKLQYELHAPLKGQESRVSANGLIGTLFRLASTYEKLNELDLAYKYYKVALDIHYQLQRNQPIDKPNSHHPLLIALLHGAATTANLLGHYEDSLFAYESLMETLRKDNVQDKRLLIPTLHHLGLLNDVLGHVAKASKYYRWALEMLESQENLKESAAAVNIRMNVLCLADPLSEDPKPKLPMRGSRNQCNAAYDSVQKYCLNSMVKIYQRQDYVHRDAAMAITYRNGALVYATHLKHYGNAKKLYEHYLETIWYHCRESDPTLSPASSTSNNPLVGSRSFVVSQAMYGLGLVERKSKQYAAARHYQKEGLALLAKAKKQQLCGKSLPLSTQDKKRMSNLYNSINREIQLLNSGCVWMSWVKE